MASALKNLSEYAASDIDISNKKIALVVSSYYEEITGVLSQGAFDTLVKEGAKEENIIIKTVPGTFELTVGAQWMS
jgi:6,7-dimethyl-8-ribityllumazine synthase